MEGKYYMKPDFAMTQQEAEEMQKDLRKIFTIVRLLEADAIPTGDICSSTECKCFTFWKKSHRCENCTSRKAFLEKSQKTKLEFLEGKIYQVISRYLEIDGNPFVMEMVSELDEDAVVDNEGREALIKKLTGYDRELYIDALTGAYNRRY